MSKNLAIACYLNENNSTYEGHLYIQGSIKDNNDSDIQKGVAVI